MDALPIHCPMRWILLSFLALGLMGCGGSDEYTDSNQHLRLGNGAEPATLDFHRASGLTELRILMALFEGLVVEHPSEDGGIAPGIAKSWDLSDDLLTYTFFLRPDAQWSDGQPILAQQFVDSARRVLDPDLGATLATHYDFVSGAADYRARTITDFDQVGIQALDKHTLTMQLASPTPFFLQLLKQPVFYPYRDEMLNAEGMPTLFTGPFILQEWTPNERLIVARNKNYVGPNAPQLDKITFFPISDSGTEERAFRSGQIDYTAAVPPASIQRLRGTGEPSYIESPHLATAYMLFNTTEGPTADPELRRILSLAIDRELIVNAVVGLGQPATHFTPSAIANHSPDESAKLRFDPETTKAALDIWLQRNAKPSLTYSVSMNENANKVAEAIQGMWREHLGLEVTIEQTEWRVFLNKLNSADYDIGFLAWYGDYVDPYTFLNVFRSTSPTNRARWTSEMYDAALDKSLQTTGDERKYNLQAAETLLMEALPIAPVYWVSQPHRIATKLKNFPPKLLDWRSYHSVYLDP